MATKKSTSKSRRIKSSPYKTIIVVVVVSVLGILYYRAQLALRPQPIDIMEVGTAASGVADISFSTTDNRTIALTLNTNNAKVTAAQVEVSYDSSALGDPTIALGEFLPLKIAPSTAKNGVATIIAAAPLESGGKSGSGQIATLTFPRSISQPTTLSITNSSMVAAIGYDTNVLNTTAKITLSPNESPIVEVTTPTQVANPTTSNTTTPSTPTTQKTTPPQTKKQNETTNSPDSNRTLTPTNFGSNINAVAPATSELPLTSTEVEPAPTSAFARFIAWINLLFKSKSESEELE